MYTVQFIIGIIKGVQKKNILLLVFTIQATMIENKMICIQLLLIDILQKSISSNQINSLRQYQFIWFKYTASSSLCKRIMISPL